MGNANVLPSHRTAAAYYVPPEQRDAVQPLFKLLGITSAPVAVAFWRAFLSTLPKSHPLRTAAKFNRRLMPPVPTKQLRLLRTEPCVVHWLSDTGSSGSNGSNGTDDVDAVPVANPDGVQPVAGPDSVEHLYVQRANLLRKLLRITAKSPDLEQQLVHVILGGHRVCGRDGARDDGVPVDAAYAGDCCWFGSFAVWMWLLAVAPLRGVAELGFRLVHERRRRGFVTDGQAVKDTLLFMAGEDALAACERGNFRKHLLELRKNHPLLAHGDPCITVSDFGQLVVRHCPAVVAQLLDLQNRVRHAVMIRQPARNPALFSAQHLAAGLATLTSTESMKAVLRQVRVRCRCLTRADFGKDVLQWTSAVRWPANTLPRPTGHNAPGTHTPYIKRRGRCVDEAAGSPRVHASAIVTASKKRGEGREHRLERASRAAHARAPPDERVDTKPPWESGQLVSAADEAAWAIALAVERGDATCLEDLAVGCYPATMLEEKPVRTWVSRHRHVCGAAVAITYLFGLDVVPSVPTVDATGKLLPPARRDGFGKGFNKLPKARHVEAPLTGRSSASSATAGAGEAVGSAWVSGAVETGGSGSGDATAVGSVGSESDSDGDGDGDGDSGGYTDSYADSHSVDGSSRGSSSVSVSTADTATRLASKRLVAAQRDTWGSARSSATYSTVHSGEQGPASSSSVSQLGSARTSLATRRSGYASSADSMSAFVKVAVKRAMCGDDSGDDSDGDGTNHLTKRGSLRGVLPPTHGKIGDFMIRLTPATGLPSDAPGHDGAGADESASRVRQRPRRARQQRLHPLQPFRALTVVQRGKAAAKATEISASGKRNASLHRPTPRRAGHGGLGLSLGLVK